MKYYNVHSHYPVALVDEFAIVDLSGKDVAVEDSYFSQGMHPLLLSRLNLNDESIRICKSSRDKRMLAIGECGLDKLSSTSLSVQIMVFELLIGYSELYGMPLIVHCVKAFDELIAIYKRLQPKQRWIIHGFRGNEHQLMQLLKYGFGFSFGKYFNANALRSVPDDRLFAESDDNQSADIREVYRTIAEVRQVSDSHLSKVIEDNFLKTFKFKI